MDDLFEELDKISKMSTEELDKKSDEAYKSMSDKEKVESSAAIIVHTIIELKKELAKDDLHRQYIQFLVSMIEKDIGELVEGFGSSLEEITLRAMLADVIVGFSNESQD